MAGNNEWTRTVWRSEVDAYGLRHVWAEQHQIAPSLPEPRPERGEAVVRVRCGRCDRVLGELWGTATDGIRHMRGHEDGLESRPSTWFVRRAARAAPSGSPLGERLMSASARKRYRCDRRCGADYPVRLDKLAAAFRVAAGRPRKRDRVIRLPADVSGA